MVSNGISFVQVKPYAVKQSKEIDDNSQLKDNRKDPKIIANLVKNGNYRMPYPPEAICADMRRFSMFRVQLTKDRIRNINCLHREMKIYFPEYMNALEKIDGAFALEILRMTPIPFDIVILEADELKNIWHGTKFRERGYSKGDIIVDYAKRSVGLTEGTDTGKEAIK